jgi:RNA-directed DNA polymerase
MTETKPYKISKHQVLEAYKRVKANRGAAGVDEESLSDFEREWQNNLYKIWNRLSSGSYFPPPVRTVAIPKSGGGERELGIPTVADRVAQMVVKMQLEPELEPLFHPDSYGYRPGKSAHQAVGMARQRCWRRNWVLDLDIKGFFDNIPHDLLLKAVRKHARDPWVVLYIERWLSAPSQDKEGTLRHREKGTPQGGVISPLLANLFLHYAFDDWLRRNQPHVPFERYADDAIVHCRSQAQADYLRWTLTRRLAECGLELHPQKTKIVYCKDDDRASRAENEKFDFLGYRFQARRSKNRHGKFFVNFLPAISDKAAKAIRDELRSWKLHLRSDKSLDDLSRMFNPTVRGWVQYYGRYYRSMLYPVFRQLDRSLVRWACRKYKKLRSRHRRATHWLRRISRRNPGLFAHWQLGGRNTASSMGAG